MDLLQHLLPTAVSNHPNPVAYIASRRFLAKDIQTLLQPQNLYYVPSPTFVTTFLDCQQTLLLVNRNKHLPNDILDSIKPE
jgi:hypothetical protein